MSPVTNRFQMDLSRSDLELIDRLATLAGMKTKKELLMNAVTLFKWAAQESLYDRSVCSISNSDGRIRQLELPAITTIVEAARQQSKDTEAELERRLQEPRRSLSEILNGMKERSAHVAPSGAAD